MTPRNPPMAGPACSMTFGQLRHGPQCWPGGMTPRNPPMAGSGCSMTFGQLRHGPQCWPGGSVPGRGPARCELATRLREAVESHACYSLVSAPTDHSTVVTTATVIGTAVTRHRPCGDRWGDGDQVEAPGRAPAPGELHRSVAAAGCGKGRRVLVSAQARQITWSTGVERERVTTWIRIGSPKSPTPGAVPPSRPQHWPPLDSSP